MFDVKKLVYSALKNDSTLVGLLGSTDKIQFYYPNDFALLPIVTYQELNQYNADEDYYDDSVFAATSEIQIDVWVSSGSTSTIVKRIDSIMQGLLFNVDYSGDMYESDTKIQHRVVRYSRRITADDLD